MLRASLHAQKHQILDIGSGVILEQAEYAVLQKNKVGDAGIEIYFSDIGKVGLFDLTSRPSEFREGYFTLGVAGDAPMFVPITKRIYEKHPQIKFFHFTGFEEDSSVSEISKKKRGIGKKLMLPFALALGITAGAALWTKIAPKDGPSLLQHHSLSSPIPGVMLYDTIEVNEGQNLEQIAGEYLLSMKYLHELNPQLSGNTIDGIINTKMSLLVPKAQDIFRLIEPMSWNQIGEKYSIDPSILMRVNGTNVALGDIIVIPTNEQAQDIAQYLTGEDVECLLYKTSTPTTLEKIALYMDIPEHLHELFYELNLASDDDKSPAAIHSKTQVLQPEAKFIVPMIRDFSREIISKMDQKHHTYDVHIVGANDTIESIMKYYGITAEVFQKLNPTIPINSALTAGMQIRTRDTTKLMNEVCAQIVLPDNVLAFVAEREMGTKKEGYLRPGISQMKTIEIERIIKEKGKKSRKVKEKKEVFKFPNDGITLEPGCDLGQIDENILRYALDTIVEPAIIERIVLLSKTVQAYRKTKGADGKIPAHAMKEIPPEFADIANLKLTEKQTKDVKMRIMQAYWDTYLKKHIPNIDTPGFVTDDMRAVLLSIIYHRGGYFFSSEELNLMREGKWSDPIILDAVKRGKKGTESRTKEEVELFRSGLESLGALRQP